MNETPLTSLLSPTTTQLPISPRVSQAWPAFSYVSRSCLWRASPASAGKTGRKVAAELDASFIAMIRVP
jgi:hypothetical protein